MSIKGFSSQKKLTRKLTGLTEAQSVDKDKFVTAQYNFSDKVGLDVVNSGVYVKSANLSPIPSTTEPKRIVGLLGHGAAVGDIFRIQQTGNPNSGFESSIIAVPDANTIVLANEAPNNILAGDICDILRSITQRFTSNGGIVVGQADVNLIQVAGQAVDTGAGSGGSGTQRVALDSDSTVRITDSNQNPIETSGIHSGYLKITNEDQILYTTLSSDGMSALIGQKKMNESVPVTMAEDQTPIEIDLRSVSYGTISVTDSGLAAVIGPNSGGSTASNSILVAGQFSGAQYALKVQSTSGELITMPYAQYNSGGVALTNGTRQTLQMSTTGALKVTGGGNAMAKARIDYSSTNVTTAAYVTLLAAAAANIITEVEIFDSSGQTLVLAFGGAGSEVDKIYIIPGGNGRIPLAIPGNTRVSVKAVSATASVGELTVNFYG